MTLRVHGGGSLRVRNAHAEQTRKPLVMIKLMARHDVAHDTD